MTEFEMASLHAELTQLEQLALVFGAVRFSVPMESSA